MSDTHKIEFVHLGARTNMRIDNGADITELCDCKDFRVKVIDDQLQVLLPDDPYNEDCKLLGFVSKADYDKLQKEYDELYAINNEVWEMHDKLREQCEGLKKEREKLIWERETHTRAFRQVDFPLSIMLPCEMSQEQGVEFLHNLSHAIIEGVQANFLGKGK
jgi:hypothetical protein